MKNLNRLEEKLVFEKEKEIKIYKGLKENLNCQDYLIEYF